MDFTIEKKGNEELQSRNGNDKQGVQVFHRTSLYTISTRKQVDNNRATSCLLNSVKRQEKQPWGYTNFTVYKVVLA